MTMMMMMMMMMMLIDSDDDVDTVFSRLNAGGVYLNLGLVDPAFIRTRRLFGVRRLFIKCIFHPSSFLSSVLEVY